MGGRADSFKTAGESGIDCVFLTCFEGEVEVLAWLLRSSGIRIHFADTLEKAEFLLIVTNATVLLSDSLFLDGSWRDAAAMLDHFFPGVQLVLVLAADDRAARAQAHENAVQDLLYRPLRVNLLRRAIEEGHRSAAERQAPAHV